MPLLETIVPFLGVRVRKPQIREVRRRVPRPRASFAKAWHRGRAVNVDREAAETAMRLVHAGKLGKDEALAMALGVMLAPSKASTDERSAVRPVEPERPLSAVALGIYDSPSVGLARLPA